MPRPSSILGIDKIFSQLGKMTGVDEKLGEFDRALKGTPLLRSVDGPPVAAVDEQQQGKAQSPPAAKVSKIISCF
jgi:hypothetical protein